DDAAEQANVPLAPAGQAALAMDRLVSQARWTLSHRRALALPRSLDGVGQLDWADALVHLLDGLPAEPVVAAWLDVLESGRGHHPMAALAVAALRRLPTVAPVADRMRKVLLAAGPGRQSLR